MRDPMTWALTVFRAFGIPVRVHLFFVLVTLGLFFRQVLSKNNPVGWGDAFALTVLLLFGLVLLHEFGHCFAARWVGGDAREILIWPLGGLAFVEVPHYPRPHFITAAAGPAVNVLVCVVCAAAMLTANFAPNLDPLADPYKAVVRNVKDGREYTSPYWVRAYKPGTATPVDLQKAIDDQAKGPSGREHVLFTPAQADEEAARAGGERMVAPSWVVWAQRTFWMSWVLFLFNLLPAYPLDGGQMLQAVVWGRSDYRRGTTIAAYSGFAVAVAFTLVAITVNESLFLGLALFMLVQSSAKLHALEVEDGPFGYDFSAGYTSLEKDDPPPPRRKRPGPLTRWWLARKAKKFRREAEERQRDEERMDELLDKINRAGKDSLTDEERRFLQRASSRYKNRS